MRVAILDDYQNVALSMADWSDVAARAEITVFNITAPTQTPSLSGWRRSTWCASCGSAHRCRVTSSSACRG